MIHITSYGPLLLVVVFKHTIFVNLFLKTPTFQGWLDGRSCSCMLYSENHSKPEHEMGGRNMRYTLDLIVVSIGIIELFQLVSILTFLVYSYMFWFMYVCLHFKEYQFRLVSIFSYIYMFYLCLLYPYIFKHKSCLL